MTNQDAIVFFLQLAAMLAVGPVAVLVMVRLDCPRCWS